LLGLAGTEEGSGELQRVLEEYRLRLERGFFEAQELQEQREGAKAQCVAMEAEYTSLFERANVQIEAFVRCDEELHQLRHLAMVGRGHVIESLAVGWARKSLAAALERWSAQLALRRCRRELDSTQHAVAQDMLAVEAALQMQQEEYLTDCDRRVEELKAQVYQDKRVLVSEILELQNSLDAAGDSPVPPNSPGFVDRMQHQLEASRQAVWRLTEERNDAMERAVQLQGELTRAEEKAKAGEAAADRGKGAFEQARDGELTALRASVRALRKKGGQQEVELQRTAEELREASQKLDGLGDLQAKVAGYHDLMRQNSKLREQKKKAVEDARHHGDLHREVAAKFSTQLKAYNTLRRRFQEKPAGGWPAPPAGSNSRIEERRRVATERLRGELQWWTRFLLARGMGAWESHASASRTARLHAEELDMEGERLLSHYTDILQEAMAASPSRSPVRPQRRGSPTAGRRGEPESVGGNQPERQRERGEGDSGRLPRSRSQSRAGPRPIFEAKLPPQLTEHLLPAGVPAAGSQPGSLQGAPGSLTPALGGIPLQALKALKAEATPHGSPFSPHEYWRPDAARQGRVADASTAAKVEEPARGVEGSRERAEAGGAAGSTVDPPAGESGFAERWLEDTEKAVGHKLETAAAAGGGGMASAAHAARHGVGARPAGLPRRRRPSGSDGASSVSISVSPDPEHNLESAATTPLGTFTGSLARTPAFDNYPGDPERETNV